MNSVVIGNDAVADTRPAVRKAGLKRLLMLGGGLVVLGAAAAYGAHWWTVGRFIETTDDAYIGGDITVIAPQVAGLITTVAVTDNQAVHAGDLLVKLDDRDYRAALDKADATMAGDRAAIANLEATRRLQLANIAQAQAEIAATAAEIVRAHEDDVRFRALAANSAAPLQTFQRADAAYKQALAEGAKAEAARDAAASELDVIGTSRQQAQAVLDGALADRDTARLNLGYTELRAPIDGTVGDRAAEAGAYAPVGAALISIVPARGLWIDANFKENQLAGMRRGEPVTIAADALPGQVFHGHVASLAPATGAEFSILPAENATGNFTKIVQRVPVRISLDGDAASLGALRPGLSVTAEVDQRQAEPRAP